MDTTITSQNYTITEELRNYTSKKLQKLQPYAEVITSVRIFFHNEHLNHIAEGHIQVPGNTIIAKAESQSMPSSMDALIDKLIRQLKTHRGKATDRR